MNRCKHCGRGPSAENIQRAAWACTAVDAHALETRSQREELGTKITDLLTNLRHLASHNDLNPVELWSMSGLHFTAEQAPGA